MSKDAASARSGLFRRAAPRPSESGAPWNPLLAWFGLGVALGRFPAFRRLCGRALVRVLRGPRRRS